MLKIISFYLPQFHSIPENDEAWGKGFTEWDNVKSAKKLYKNHYQPRVPKNKNYYSLMDVNTLRWQAGLANDYGIYGFCFYHYWFNDGKLLLEKPIEMFLENKDIDIKFCLSWANEAWTQAWVSKSDRVIVDQNYGNEETWLKHFNYLIRFFKDDRYIKDEGKPLFVIYRPELITDLNSMLDYWDKLAIKNGFPGIKYAYQGIWFDKVKDRDDSRFDFNIEYEPAYAMDELSSKSSKKLTEISKKIDKFCLKYIGFQPSNYLMKSVRKLDYDSVWQASLKHKPNDEKCVAGAFVDWDNTPRRGEKGLVIQGANPEKFKSYLSKKISQVKQIYSSDYLFLFAWNEWAEGGYLEPDEKFGNEYLKAVKAAIEENENGI
ncbi:glycosyltransferase WbsX family protein [Ileibacterium valens]|uniref:glycosyltransferase WbsX family protein n=1 Tax=Ileibacterium valens TaxID=1862668 RepID=UPI00272AA134|nr:glycoside hydrolase family 99-like domain-containing protein [Ileibacterium valens]